MRRPAAPTASRCRENKNQPSVLPLVPRSRAKHGTGRFSPSYPQHRSIISLFRASVVLRAGHSVSAEWVSVLGEATTGTAGRRRCRIP